MSGDVTMMHGYLMTGAGHAATCLSSCLAVARSSVPVATPGRNLAFATLGSWLMTEGLGAFMLGSLVAGHRRGRRAGQPAGASPPVVYGHAGLALAGFTCWIGFLATSAAALGWLGIGFLALAIGLGVSTVTIWTPFPTPAGLAASAGAGPKPGAGQPDGDVRSPAPARQPDDLLAKAGSPDALARALSDEALTSKLVDDLLASMLAKPAPRPRRLGWSLAPLIPIAHGVLAIATFLLATLAVIRVS